MAAVECLTQEQAQSCLEDLKIGLLTLHHYLPIGNQYYNFETYKPEPEAVQDYGAEGALNRDLENIFCPKGRAGPICLKEIVILKPITQQKQAAPPVISASKELGESDWVFG